MTTPCFNELPKQKSITSTGSAHFPQRFANLPGVDHQPQDADAHVSQDAQSNRSESRFTLELPGYHGRIADAEFSAFWLMMLNRWRSCEFVEMVVS